MRAAHVIIEVDLGDGESPLVDEFDLEEEDLDMAKDVLKKLVGDGLARVSVNTGLSDKDFGNGFSVMVSVALTCDQNSATLEDAFLVAQALSSEYAGQAYDEAADLYRNKRSE